MPVIHIYRYLSTMNKQIDDILLDWAMESHDGLLSGPWTNENVTALKNVLVSHKVSNIECDRILTEVMGLEEAPRLSDEERQRRQAEKDAKAELRRRAREPEKSVAGDVFSQLRIDKGLSNVFVDSMKKIVIKYPDYLSKYDSIDVPNSDNFPLVVEEYNKLENHAVNREINSITGPSLGKGELIFVWLIKNCKSGGSGKGDVILSNGQKIDAKVYESDKSFRIEQNSIDNFQGLPFFVALMDLVSELRSDPMVKDVLISILNTNIEGESPIHPSTIIKTTEFIENLNLDTVSRSAFNGLFELGKRLKDMEVENESDVLSINAKGEKFTAALTNPSEVIPNVSRLSSPKTVKMDVAPIEDPSGKVIIPRLKRLKFFSENIDAQRITNEIVGSLHYDGIVFLNKLGEKAQYVDKKEFGEKIKFNRFAKGVNLIFVP